MKNKNEKNFLSINELENKFLSSNELEKIKGGQGIALTLCDMDSKIDIKLTLCDMDSKINSTISPSKS